MPTKTKAQHLGPSYSTTVVAHLNAQLLWRTHLSSLKELPSSQNLQTSCASWISASPYSANSSSTTNLERCMHPPSKSLRLLLGSLGSPKARLWNPRSFLTVGLRAAPRSADLCFLETSETEVRPVPSRSETQSGRTFRCSRAVTNHRHETAVMKLQKPPKSLLTSPQGRRPPLAYPWAGVVLGGQKM